MMILKIAKNQRPVEARLSQWHVIRYHPTLCHGIQHSLVCHIFKSPEAPDELRKLFSSSRKLVLVKIGNPRNLESGIPGFSRFPVKISLRVTQIKPRGGVNAGVGRYSGTAVTQTAREHSIQP